MKNSTRIASLLGTWTGTTHLKTSIGDYELMAYFVIHFMPDPSRNNQCTLENCNEYENKICQLSRHSQVKENKSCMNLSETGSDDVSTWSDLSAFMYFGAKIDVGFPFNKHRAEDTGSWIGPLNIILAQDTPHIQGPILDRYLTRYVKTPSTPYLRMPDNSSLINERDFDNMAGATAVNNTQHSQYTIDDTDPYQKYEHTCEHGNVEPLLPLFEFNFVDNDQGEEMIEVKLDYKLMTMPRKKDYMYGIYPKIKNRVNRADLGFHISGPYCYGDDPNRGWSFDMNFDSKEPKQMLNLVHACVEGLPCVPPAAELYAASGNGSGEHMNPIPDDATTVDFAQPLLFMFIWSLMGIALIFMYRSNRKLKRRLQEHEYSNGDHETQQPLLSDNELGESTVPYIAMNTDADDDNIFLQGLEMEEEGIAEETTNSQQEEVEINEENVWPEETDEETQNLVVNESEDV